MRSAVVTNTVEVLSCNAGDDRLRAAPKGQFPRPRRALGPIAGALLGLGAWAAVAHSSGSGWVQALGALLAGFLTIGMVAPCIITRRARSLVLANPTDTTARDDVNITLRVSTPLKVSPVSPLGPESTSGSSKTMSVTLRPEHRGEISACVLDISSAAPFGLLWWHKLVTLPLVNTMFVAPRLGEPDLGEIGARNTQGDLGRSIDARVGEPRGIRPYRPGDKRSWVHWPATAHSGSLMVREMEVSVTPPVTIRVRLPLEPERAEQIAERVLGTVAKLIDEGRQIILVTLEKDGIRSSLVVGVTDAGRRLAAAIPEQFEPGTRPVAVAPSSTAELRR